MASFPFCLPLLEKKINPEGHDVIHWLNKNLKAHIMWYIEKETSLIVLLGRLLEY